MPTLLEGEKPRRVPRLVFAGVLPGAGAPIRGFPPRLHVRCRPEQAGAWVLIPYNDTACIVCVIAGRGTVTPYTLILRTLSRCTRFGQRPPSTLAKSASAVRIQFMASTRHCWKCGSEYKLPGAPGRLEACPCCNSDLKVCLNCVSYDPRVAEQCRDRRAEPRGREAPGQLL